LRNPPSIAIPEREKDEAYHRSHAEYIIRNTLTDGWADKYSLYEELYKFYNKGSDGELTRYLRETSTGTTLPAYWISAQTIKTKIDLLAGELEERGEEIIATAINKEAVDRRLEEKERLRVERKLRNDPAIQQAQQVAEIPLFKHEYVPQSDEELDEYFDLSFKDKSELILTGALQWICDTQRWEDERVKGFMDINIASSVIHRVDISRGKPRAVRVDPMCFLVDPDATDDSYSDATFFGEAYYMPLAAAAEEYGLSLEELKEVEGRYNDHIASGNSSFGGIVSQRWRWFQNNNNNTRVLVVKTCWLDNIDLEYKEESDENAEYIQFSPVRRKRDKDKIKVEKLAAWRECVIIGGQIVKKWGVVPNQPRSLNTLETTEPPYHVWQPNRFLGKSVSKTEQIAGLQLYKDILLYNLQLEITSSPGRILQYDLAMKPEGMTNEEVQSYIKSNRVVYVNSKEYQLTTGAQDMVKAIDLTLTTSINQIIGVIQYIDSEIDRVSGVSPERQGQIQGASQGLGVTHAAISGSNLITASLFRGYYRHCSRVLNHVAKMIKIVWPKNKELFAPIIGTVGVDFLREHVDLDLDDHAIVVQALPPLLTNRDKFDQFVMTAVQADPTLLPDALDLLMDRDLKSAVRRLQKKFQLRKAIEMQAARAEEERQQQFQAQMQQAEQQAQQQAQMGEMDLQKLKNDANTQRAIISSRTKLQSEKLKALQVS